MARRFSNYNIGKGYGRISVACQTDAFREKKYIKKMNQGNRSEEEFTEKGEHKEGGGEF